MDTEWIPLDAAARQLGISIHAARRRVKSGTLAGRRTQTRYGLVWEVCLDDGATVAPDSRNGSAGVTSGLRTPDAGVPGGFVELVSLVDRLQRENRDMAGLIGSLQTRVEVLSGQLEQTQRALEAPKGEQTTPGPSAAVEPATEAQTRPWWRRW
jgi:hypothetical protein